MIKKIQNQDICIGHRDFYVAIWKESRDTAKYIVSFN